MYAGKKRGHNRRIHLVFCPIRKSDCKKRKCIVLCEQIPMDQLRQSLPGSSLFEQSLSGLTQGTSMTYTEMLLAGDPSTGIEVYIAVNNLYVVVKYEIHGCIEKYLKKVYFLQDLFGGFNYMIREPMGAEVKHENT